MDELAQYQEWFTWTGTVLGAVASLVTIVIAIGEALKPGRLERRIARLSRTLEHEKNPDRIAALTRQRIELEASLFARERVPGNQYVLWIIAVLLPFVNQIASVSDRPATWTKIVTVVIAAIICWQVSRTLLEGLLQRRIVQNRYIAGQDPFKTLPDVKKYRFTAQRGGKSYAGIVALYAFILILNLLTSWWNQGISTETIFAGLGIIIAYSGLIFMLTSDIIDYTNGIANEYVLEWHVYTQQSDAQSSNGEES